MTDLVLDSLCFLGFGGRVLSGLDGSVDHGGVHLKCECPGHVPKLVLQVEDGAEVIKQGLALLW